MLFFYENKYLQKFKKNVSDKYYNRRENQLTSNFEKLNFYVCIINININIL